MFKNFYSPSGGFKYHVLLILEKYFYGPNSNETIKIVLNGFCTLFLNTQKNEIF